jgi:hypothetical protein
VKLARRQPEIRIRFGCGGEKKQGFERMTKTILVEAVARIGRPKNNWCLGRLGKAHREALLGSPIVLKEAEALDQWRKRPDPPRLGKAGQGLPRRTRGEQGAP